MRRRRRRPRRAAADRRRLPYVRRPSGPREPPGQFEYRVRAVSRSVADQWDRLAGQHASSVRRCFDHLARTPLRPTMGADRCGPLLAKAFRERGLWQYEVTGAARVWYRVDQPNRLVEVVEVHFGHPKDTE